MSVGRINLSPARISSHDGLIAFMPFTTSRKDTSFVFSEKWSSLTIKKEGNDLVYYYKSRWGEKHDMTVRQPL